MKIKNANRIFLAAMLCHILLELVIWFTPILDVLPWNMATNVFLSEACLWLPVAVGGLLCGCSLKRHCRIRMVRGSTLLMTVVFTVLIDPLATLANSISMLFVENTVVGITPEILEMSFPVMLFFIAVYGPLAEELTFRGVLFHSYRRGVGAWKAILMSALLFGLMHMNLNQAGYAVVIGIALALLTEATGSMVPGFLVHFLFNAKSVCALFLVGDEAQNQANAALDAAQEALQGDYMMLIIAIFTLMVVVETPLAVCALIYIAKKENRREMLQSLLPSGEKTKAEIPMETLTDSGVTLELSGEAVASAGRERLLTPALIAGMLICICMIVLDLIL